MSEANGSFVILKQGTHILLARDRRTPAKFNLLGGGVGLGELPVDAGVREVFEESGIVVFREHMRLVGTYIMRKRYGMVSLYEYSGEITEVPCHTCEEVSEKKFFLPSEILTLPEEDIYPAQKSLIRHYLQWQENGKVVGETDYLSPPFQTQGKFFENL